MNVWSIWRADPGRTATLCRPPRAWSFISAQHAAGGELYLPQKALERRKEARREEEEDRAWLRDFQEKVKAGEIAPQLFLCPTCGNPRRDRTCPFCGSVVDLKTMEEICPGKPS